MQVPFKELGLLEATAVFISVKEGRKEVHCVGLMKASVHLISIRKNSVKDYYSLLTDITFIGI